MSDTSASTQKSAMRTKSGATTMNESAPETNSAAKHPYDRRPDGSAASGSGKFVHAMETKNNLRKLQDAFASQALSNALVGLGVQTNTDESSISSIEPLTPLSPDAMAALDGTAKFRSARRTESTRAALMKDSADIHAWARNIRDPSSSPEKTPRPLVTRSKPHLHVHTEHLGPASVPAIDPSLQLKDHFDNHGKAAKTKEASGLWTAKTLAGNENERDLAWRLSKSPASACINTEFAKDMRAAAIGNTATTQPPASGLFGSSTSQPAQSGGLFGSTPASQPAQSGGLFGGAAATPATSAQSGGLFKLGAPPAASSQSAGAAGGGLFGGSTTTSQPATGGLFGAAPATSKSTGLFGGSTMASSTPATGGLFGTTAPASSAPAAGGLFGNTATASQPAASGGLFGAAAPAASKPGGLFGSTTAASQPATGGLFGASTTAQPATGGLFGAKPAAPPGGLFGASQPAAKPATGGGLFGSLNNSTLNTSTTNPSQQPIQAVKVDWSNVKPTTRFSELHEEVQSAILFLDEIITGAIRCSMQVTETLPTLDKSVQAIGPDVEYLERRLDVVEGALGRDAVDVASVKEIVMKGEEDAVNMFRAVENLKLPGGFQYAQLGGSVDPTSTTTTDLLSFFGKRAEELHQQAGQFEKSQRDVDQHLRMVEASAVDKMRRLGQQKAGASAAERTGEGLREIAGVMRTFEEAILRVAERVGEGREAVVELELGRAR